MLAAQIILGILGFIFGLIIAPLMTIGITFIIAGYPTIGIIFICIGMINMFIKLFKD